ncbi:hypothetical protein IAG25_39765 [Caballeronia sp. EK]|uniref:hypothetical protein n=1 Tax=Caballeronia sp. EK TaxID=2767469 RepID=UPI0019C4B6D6|nr:hypothetical protein [Caballeronia sp. EK]MBC8642918.1 hypothetical protein [Caballeronia sp. EK]
MPPELIVLGNTEAARRLREEQEMPDSNGTSFDVVSRLCNVWLFAYSSGGRVYHVAKENQMEVNGLRDVLTPAFRSFVKSEFDLGSIVAAAPQGFYFAKLSNRVSSHFIRTESLLSCTASIEFVALRLLDSFTKYCDGLPEAKVRVLVDSMAIWPVAQALISMRKAIDSQRRYVIESFRSYEGLEEVSLDSGPAFAIISASTSGGLEARIFEILGHRHVECFTVLGLEPRELLAEKEAAEHGRKILFNLPRRLTGPSSLAGLRPQFETDVGEIPPGCEAVRIIGERFLSQNFKPKSVRLAAKALPAPRRAILTKISSDRVALVARRRPGGQSFWSLSFDTTRLVDMYCVDNANGECLLRSWLTNYAAAGNTAVVYPVDTLEKGRPGEGEAKRMAELARTLLTEKSPGADIRVLNSSDLDRPSDEMRTFILRASVVVVAPILGNGFIFKQISASLRATQPKGPRLYLALAVLPESDARLKELQNDLQLNADDSRYQFKARIELPIGKIDQDLDWFAEAQLVKKVVDECSDQDIEAPEGLSGRLLRFREGNGLPGPMAFMPSYVDSPPAMSPGFLLWQPSPPLAGIDLGSGVLLTVAVFLEACRAAGSKDSETSLISGLFQQTLISPANFTRFNDPAIQAALLRAAYKSELNYSASPDLSGDMQRLILRLMDLHDAPAGEALPEFMLALAMERVTLVREHMSAILEKARGLPGWLRILAEELPGFQPVRETSGAKIG